MHFVQNSFISGLPSEILHGEKVAPTHTHAVLACDQGRERADALELLWRDYWEQGIGMNHENLWRICSTYVRDGAKKRHITNTTLLKGQILF